MELVKGQANRVGSEVFPESVWEEIAERVGESFRMGEDEKASLKESRIAKLIAAIPFLAGCDEAKRTAVAHLGTFVLSVRPATKSCFNSHEADGETVLERLRLISCFKGGDEGIIQRGLGLLALNMVSDYRRDIEEDAKLGKYNPVAAGAWDYEKLAAELRDTIHRVECPEMDAILPVEYSPLMFWL